MANTTIAAAPGRLSTIGQQDIESQKPKQPEIVTISSPSEKVATPEHARIDVIPLFGSHKLMRGSDGRTWIFITPTANPKRLTTQQSMFINAALSTAGGQ